QLPNQNVCRESVLQYNPSIVVNSLEKILKTYYFKGSIKKEFLNKNGNGNIELAFRLVNLIKENNLSINAVFSIIDDDFSDKYKSVLLTEIGVLLWNNKLYDDVIIAFQIALDYNPKNNDALYNLGFILNELGQSKLALSYLDAIDNKDADVVNIINNIKQIN